MYQIPLHSYIKMQYNIILLYVFLSGLHVKIWNQGKNHNDDFVSSSPMYEYFRS